MNSVKPGADAFVFDAQGLADLRRLRRLPGAPGGSAAGRLRVHRCRCPSGMPPSRSHLCHDVERFEGASTDVRRLRRTGDAGEQKRPGIVLGVLKAPGPLTWRRPPA